MPIYEDQDADLSLFNGLTVAVLGFGAQGSAHARNLRDSGVNVIIGQREQSPGFERARSAGFTPVTVGEAAERADLIIMGLPDESAAKIYREEIAADVAPGTALGFVHGFNVTFGYIDPPAECDVIMISPKGPGSLVRSTYEQGIGVPALLAIHRDASGNAKQLALAWAKGIGATRAGVFETTFRAETVGDLFGEQVVLCGGMTALMQAAFDVLVEAGFEPHIAYFECIHEMKQIADLVYERGISRMREMISNTAEYGDLTRGPRVIDEHVRQRLREILAEIESGAFAREWMNEQMTGRKQFTELFEAGWKHPSESVGEMLRAHMPWLNT
jgi:ketol-acid reductoisomerase